MEHVQMNAKLRRERLKSSSKAMREMRGDVVHERELTWELEKKLKAQEIHNEGKDWELAQSGCWLLCLRHLDTDMQTRLVS
jgi:hypothetical protein